ncbi:MAG: rhomboid family intramembrane serine protease [Bacteroidales bacterium]|nr:rhomboid family intramembrane serine protease [Bacteroidales bacterium]
MYGLFGLHFYESELFHPHQFITYMFMHGNFGHLFFNMFALWMFGSAIENYWGSKRFLIYYFITGIGAAIAHYAIVAWELIPALRYIDACIADPTVANIQALAQHHRFAFDGFNSELALGFEHFKQYVTQLESGVNTAEAKSAVNEYLIQYREYYVSRPNIVGASGSVFGLLLAFGMMFPNSLIYVYFLIPVKAKWFVIVYGLIELIYGISGTADGVAHFAHLGGMLFGLLLILYWKKKAKQHWEY